MRYLLLPLLVVVLDTICIISAAFFSIYIRFEDTAIAQKYLEMLISQLPIAVAVHLVVYFVFKLYGRVWRHALYIFLLLLFLFYLLAAVDCSLESTVVLLINPNINLYQVKKTKY